MGDPLASGLRGARQRGGHGEGEVQTLGSADGGFRILLWSSCVCVCWGRGREKMGVHLAKPLEAKGRDG